MNLAGLASLSQYNSQRGGQRLNAMAYGPVVGESTRSTNYGPSGSRLTARDVAVSPGLLGRYPLGSKVDARDAAGNLVGLGTYRVGDTSFYSPGRPTSNTIEFRDANRSGQVYLSPSGFRPIPRSGDVYGGWGGNAGGFSGEPQVLTTQNIPPNEDVSPTLSTNFYLNPREFGGGPNAPTYTNSPAAAPLTAFDPMGYGANPPPNEDVSPTPVNTFLSNYNPNAGTTPRRLSGGYPDLSNLPPVSVSAPYGTASNPYPIPGYGGLPSTYGGGQSWQSNASRGGGFAGLASAAAAGAGFGGGLTSQGAGFQQVSELPSGLGSISWQAALGGGRHIL